MTVPKPGLALVLAALLWSCSPPPPLPKGAPTVLTSTPMVVDSEVVPGEVAAQAKSLVVGLSSEREKALALYEWIAKNIRYDIAAYLAEDLPDPSPEVVFSTRLTVCEGYARLFVAMAKSVGLDAVMVAGFSKGFAPGDEKSRSEPDHAWNAVKIDGKWQLLDPTWGAGHIDDSKSFQAEYSTDWFAVPPEQFITSHLPEDPQWQQLQVPLSARAFWSQPSVSPLFFEYGLRLESHPDGDVVMPGELEMRLSTDRDCRLMASLYRDDQETVEKHALVERRGNDYTISVSAPEPGQYRLIVFAGPAEGDRTESTVVYNLKASSSGDAFPKTLKSFADREVRLIGPRAPLHQGVSAELVVEAPGATKMLAVMGQEQVRFEKDGDRFTAQVTPEGEKVSVFGSYDESTQFTGLLEFPVD